LELNSIPGAYWQIVTNLVMNSLIHGFDGMEHGRIEIVVGFGEGQLHLRYSDDGVGIASHIVPHLFQPFFTTKRNRGGSGLGLHLVHNLVTQGLAGRIDCITGQGKGASFVIRVPVDNKVGEP
jgi:signal transduction histidine kinase